MKTDLLTALMYASIHNFAESIRLLLHYHANPNLKVATSANTALMFAARQGNVEAVKELLQGSTSAVAGAALYTLRSNTSNYLSWLPAELRDEISRYRIIATDTTLTNKNGETAYDIAGQKLANESTEAKKTRYQAIVALLEAHRAARVTGSESQCVS
jgi:hypothetical protein